MLILLARVARAATATSRMRIVSISGRAQASYSPAIQPHCHPRGSPRMRRLLCLRTAMRTSSLRERHVEVEHHDHPEDRSKRRYALVSLGVCLRDDLVAYD